MIFEIFDFCLSYLNGVFHESTPFLFNENSLFSYLFVIISIYLVFFGIITYNVSYVLLQMMLLYKTVTKLQIYLLNIINKATSDDAIISYLSGCINTFLVGILSSFCLFIIYNLLASKHISMSCRYISVYSETFCHYLMLIFTRPDDHAIVKFLGTFLISRIAIFASYRLIYNHTTNFTIVMFAFGGSYYFSMAIDHLFIPFHWVIKYIFRFAFCLLGIFVQICEVKVRKEKEGIINFTPPELKQFNRHHTNK